MPAGRLRKRVTFQEAVQAADGGGGGATTWRNIVTVWGGLQEDRGRERVEAGRLESAMAGILTVRSSSDTREISAANRVLIDGAPYQVRTIGNPDQRNKFLELIVERGVAT